MGVLKHHDGTGWVVDNGVYMDSAPTSGNSDHTVTSDGIASAIANVKVEVLDSSVDTEPTSPYAVWVDTNSGMPLADEVDQAPTEGSTHFVTSGGVWSALNTYTEINISSVYCDLTITKIGCIKIIRFATRSVHTVIPTNTETVVGHIDDVAYRPIDGQRTNISSGALGVHFQLYVRPNGDIAIYNYTSSGRLDAVCTFPYV